MTTGRLALQLSALGCLLASSPGCGQFEADTQSTRIEQPAPPVAASRRESSATRSPPHGDAPVFRMLGAKAGLDFTRYDDISGRRRIIETTGGGVALTDYDRDGWLDVLFTNGCRVPPLSADPATPSELFRSRRGEAFARVSAAARFLEEGYDQGCAVGDVNADGFEDLYITAFGPNTLWLNNGDGTYTDVTHQTGTGVPVWSTSAAFADVNVDGRLDLYVANYLVESLEKPRLCPNPASPDGYEGCSPALFDGVEDVLFLGDGAGGFRDVTASAGVSKVPGKGLGVVISDLDQDGDAEIYVANDGEPNFLFVREDPASGEGGGRSPDVVRFTDRAVPSGVALNERGYAQASMGIAVGDYDANGFLDLFLTHFYGDTNTLYANRGDLAFEEETRGSRLGPPSRQVLGFGTVFCDFDNDGRLDLFAANGHVDDRTWMTPREPYAMPPQLFRNERDGEFSDVSRECGPYFASEWLGRGVACGDLNRDGGVDLVVSHQLKPSIALINESAAGAASASVRLVGIESHRDAWLARVEVLDGEAPCVRERTSGQSYQSACAPEVHLGMGENAKIRVRITWPSGRVDTHDAVTAGEWFAIEGGALLRAEPPG